VAILVSSAGVAEAGLDTTVSRGHPAVLQIAETKRIKASQRRIK
jgi:hypothetical protein